MQSTDKPAKFLVPFAQNDSAKVEIPATTTDATRFSQSLGSPPLTGMPPEAGGVPPQLEDFNGAMNQVARVPWWFLLGGRFSFDGTFATDPLIGGYPRGAVLPAAIGAGLIGMGEWYNNAEANSADPDALGTGWVPGYHYGATALAGQTGGTVTLTPAQAGKRVLTVAGTLTSSLVLVVPGWIYDWSVYNNTGGAFTVTVKNAATPGAVIPQNGAPTLVRCDGTACSLLAPNIGPASSGTQAMRLDQGFGRLLGVQRFTAGGSYTPSAGTARIVVELLGGGAAGAGTQTSATQNGVGGGGGSGAYAKFLMDAPVTPVAVTIGAGGTAVVGGDGGNGNPSTFGGFATAGGGTGGIRRSADSSIPNYSAAAGGGATTVTTAGVTALVVAQGTPGSPGICLGGGAFLLAGEGGSSRLGGNGHTSNNTAGATAPANSGAGGAGLAGASGASAALAGGTGGSGLCLIWEYA